MFNNLRGFVIFFFIFGLAPIAKSRRWNLFAIIYSLLTMTFVCLILFSAIFLKRVIEDSAIFYAVAYSFLLSISATHFLLLLQAFCNRKSHLELFNHFDIVDHIFRKKLRRHVSHSAENRAIGIRFMILISIFIAIKVFLIIHLYVQNVLSDFWLHCFFSIFMLRLASLQILLYVGLLKNRLEIMNEILIEIVIDQGIKHSGSHNISSAECASQKCTVFLVSNLRNNNVIYDRMLNMKKVYGQLYETSMRINKVFGWSLLFLTMQCFIDFTSSIYWTFLALDQTIPDLSSALDKFCLIVPIVILMSSMANDCSSCTTLVGCWNKRSLDLPINFNSI